MRMYSVLKKTDIIQDWSAVAQNTISKSAEYDLSNVIKSELHIHVGLDTITAHTGTKILVQTSGSKTGNEDWQDHVEFIGLIGTAATDLIEDDPLPSGSTDITLTGHALTSLGKWLFIKDTTLINSELIFESAQSTNAITVLDETTNEHAVGTAIFNIAMTQNVVISDKVNRARVVIDNTYDDNGSTLNYKVMISKIVGS